MLRRLTTILKSRDFQTLEYIIYELRLSTIQPFGMETKGVLTLFYITFYKNKILIIIISIYNINKFKNIHIWIRVVYEIGITCGPIQVRIQLVISTHVIPNWAIVKP